MQLIANSHPCELSLNCSAPMFGTWITLCFRSYSNLSSCRSVSLPIIIRVQRCRCSARSKHPAAIIVFAIQMSSSLPPQDTNIQIWYGASVSPTPPPPSVAVNAAGVGPAATLKGNAILRYQIPRTIMRLQQSLIPSNPQIIAVVLPPPVISSGRGAVACVGDAAVSQQPSQ